MKTTFEGLAVRYCMVDSHPFGNDERVHGRVAIVTGGRLVYRGGTIFDTKKFTHSLTHTPIYPVYIRTNYGGSAKGHLEFVIGIEEPPIVPECNRVVRATMNIYIYTIHTYVFHEALGLRPCK